MLTHGLPHKIPRKMFKRISGCKIYLTKSGKKKFKQSGKIFETFMKKKEIFFSVVKRLILIRKSTKDEGI